MAIEANRVVAILLAAGRGERFGGNKLAAPFLGQPLGAHAVATLSTIPFARRIIVTGSNDIAFDSSGFDRVIVAAGALMSKSIRAGVSAAAKVDCGACLIALADMPLVPEAHYRELLAAYDGAVTATLRDEKRVVPAVFPRDGFAALQSLEGDRGAHALIQGAAGVKADAGALIDIDTSADLSRHEGAR